MEWPPVKSWTRLGYKEKDRYFVAINYGGLEEKRWISFVSVLNGKKRLKVYWEEITDDSRWIPGWDEDQIQNKEQSLGSLKNDIAFLNSDENQFSCLHPSDDSGLNLIIRKNPIRKWI